MSNEMEKATNGHVSPFERIKRTNDAEMEYWSSRDLAEVLEYTQYRNFEAVIEKAKLACFNSGQHIEDHFADVSKMVGIGSGATRDIKVTLRMGSLCGVRDFNTALLWADANEYHPGDSSHVPPCLTRRLGRQSEGAANELAW